MTRKVGTRKRVARWVLLIVAPVLILGVVTFIVRTRIAQDDTSGIDERYIRNSQPSFLSTIIFGILSVKNQFQPLTLASLETTKPLVLKQSYAHAVVKRVQTGGIDIVSVCDDQASARRVIYFIHGGAWTSGLDDRYVTFALTLSKKSGYCVAMPDFSLLPAHHFPTALTELEATYMWIRTTGKPDRIVIGGDSSGANLSASLVLVLKQNHEPLPAAQFLMSPLVDLTLSSSTFKTKASVDPLQTESFVREAVDAYAGLSVPLKDPRLSPLYGDFHAYPPTIIEVAGPEIFLGDSMNLYDKITASGGTAQLDVWKGLWHAFPIVVSVPEAQQSLDRVSQFIGK